MNVILQQLIPIFYDSGDGGPVDWIILWSIIIAIEFILVLWFAINLFRWISDRTRTLKEKLFCDIYCDFPNGPTIGLIILNSLIAFGILVSWIAKLIR